MPGGKRGGGSMKCLSCSNSISLITPLVPSWSVPKREKYQLTQVDAVEWLKFALYNAI